MELFIENWFVKPDILTITSKNNLYEEINKIIAERDCNAIVTGHTLLDNPKKTLPDIKQLKKHVNLPILHPLISMSKEEINKKFKEIGLPK